MKRMPTIRINCFNSQSRSSTAQCIADAVMKFVERYPRVLFPVKHQEGIRILLRMSRGSLHRLLGDDHDCAHKFGITVLIRDNGWRQEIGIRVSVLITESRCRRANVGWHSLRRYFNSFASGVDVPMPRELPTPECRVDAHEGLRGSNSSSQPHAVVG